MMRKCLWHKQLRLRYGLSVVRRAFTLAELVVSIGILVLMMSLVGQVFNLTVKSTGQATALTEVMQQLRAFEQTLRDDLRGVQPGNSLILIQGNPVNAYWTQNGKDADDDGNPSDDKGYPHAADPEREKTDGSGNAVQPRADILMIFTARPGVSFVEAGTSPLTSNLQQVVYGHAELGEYVPSGADDPKYQFEEGPAAFPTDTLAGAEYPSDKKVSPVPAAQWHLARRSVLLVPTGVPPGALSWEAIKTPSAQGVGLSRNEILEGAVDVVGDFRYEDLVLRPVDPKTNWGSQDPWFPPSVFGNTLNIPFKDWHKPYARSKLDPAPPALYANRIGDYLLPNCASFKVEWTLNPRGEFVAGRLDGVNEVFWFDPGWIDPAHPTDPSDPLKALSDEVQELKLKTDDASKRLYADLNSLLDDRFFDGSFNPATGLPYKYSLRDRFRGRVGPLGDPKAWDQLAPDKNRPNLVVFTATRPALPPPAGTPASEPVLDPMFPGALRITIDVFDKERRLDRPIRHVMVIPIGG
ncbi:MAG: type II secretion system protein [Planctomycetota bacterium]